MKFICWLLGEHKGVPTTDWEPEPFSPGREYRNETCIRCGERYLEFRAALQAGKQT